MSFFTDPPLHDFPDRAHRLLLENPDNLRELVGAAAPDLAAGFLFPQARKLERAFALPDWRRRESDLLFSIPWRASAGEEPVEALVCLLLEQQSQEDQAMPLRTLLYAVLFWEREWKQWEDRRERGRPLRLTPVLPIIFHTGREPWAAPRAFADLFDVPDALRSMMLPWGPRFWDLPAQPLEAMRRADGAWLRAMALVRAERESAADFHAVADEAYRRLAALTATDKVRWHDLMWFLLSWTMRRRPPQERADLIALAAARHEDAIVRREVEQMTQAIGQTWEQQLLERGMAVGTISALRTVLRNLLTQRFGNLPPALVQRIEQASDAERLNACIAQVYQIAAPDELQL
jgi:hypothetical protein